MDFKYNNMRDFILSLSSNIEIASCICYGLDLETGPQLSEVIPYIEHHGIRTPIAVKLEEQLSKNISKHHTTLLHDSSSSLNSWLQYVRPAHDLCVINTVGSEDDRVKLVRDLLIYNRKQKTKFILLDPSSLPGFGLCKFDQSGYDLLKVSIGGSIYSLYYLDIVYEVLENTSDKN